MNSEEFYLIKDCIEEIYFNIEEQYKNEINNHNIKLYNPGYLSSNDIEEIIVTNMDYGGFRQKRISSIHGTEDEEYVNISLRKRLIFIFKRYK